MQIGVVGEVRFVVKKSDSSIKLDTGFQKNLILNQGLDFFGGSNGTNIFSSCVIGSGNSTPVVTQNQLDSFVAISSGAKTSSKYDYVIDSSNLYKTNTVYKYSFSNLNNVNISEVGLVSQGNVSSDYHLCTRALIKDSLGNPTVITLKIDETLDVYYKVWQVFSTLDSDYVINMLDGAGGMVSYNAKVRLSEAGKVVYANNIGVGKPLDFTKYQYDGDVFSDGLGLVLAAPMVKISDSSSRLLNPYVAGTYRRSGSYEYDLTKANGLVRSLVVETTLGVWQILYGSVANDAAINKTNKDKLTLPFEFSWGRYEGVL